jgi:hypothetical protein
VDQLTGGHSKAAFSQAKAKGELSCSSPLKPDGSHESQTGGWTSCMVAKDDQVRVRKQL